MEDQISKVLMRINLIMVGILIASFVLGLIVGGIK